MKQDQSNKEPPNQLKRSNPEPDTNTSNPKRPRLKNSSSSSGSSSHSSSISNRVITAEQRTEQLIISMIDEEDEEDLYGPAASQPSSGLSSSSTIHLPGSNSSDVLDVKQLDKEQLDNLVVLGCNIHGASITKQMITNQYADFMLKYMSKKIEIGNYIASILNAYIILSSNFGLDHYEIIPPRLTNDLKNLGTRINKHQ